MYDTTNAPDITPQDSVPPQPAQLTRLEAKLDTMLDQLDYVAAHQRRMDELVDEGMPIAREALRVAGIHLDAVEAKGYVSLVKAMKSALDNVVEGYSPEDFVALADNMVGILDVVRSLTQPEVLAIANQAADVLHRADEIKPIGVLGAVSASRDDDVQRGMAVGLQLLRQIGQAAAARKGGGLRRQARTGVSAGLDSRLASRLAPSRRPVRTSVASADPTSTAQKASATPPASPAPTSPAPASPPTPQTLGGVDLDANGFLADPAQWTPELAQLIAAAEGVELGEDAWAVINYARETYLSSGGSPNIRKITKGMGVETRSLYVLFPRAPGKTISRIAGIPKPMGCI